MIYAILIEHGDGETIAKLDEVLDAPMVGVDGYDPDREREVLATLNGYLSGRDASD